MSYKLKGRVLFVFSDPGGAKPCLALMAGCKHKNVLALSDRVYDFYNDFNCEVVNPGDDISTIIEAFKPDLIFTGTSYTSTIERRAMAIAKKKSITCWSFVDHWTAIAARFTDEKGRLFSPDMIWVIDEQAKKIAIGEGLEAEKLFISGNPYHTWLANWQPGITRGEFLQTIDITDENKKIIVFAPDPLSNINGKMKFGFDEISASIQIKDMLDNFDSVQIRNCIFLIKMHPNQNTHALELIFSGNPRYKILPANINVNETIFYADIVIGFFSSFLLEARIMDKPVIRFLVSNSFNDPFAELDIGVKADEKSLIFKILNLL